MGRGAGVGAEVFLAMYVAFFAGNICSPFVKHFFI